MYFDKDPCVSSTAQLLVIRIAHGTETFKWKFSHQLWPQAKKQRKTDPPGDRGHSVMTETTD